MPVRTKRCRSPILYLVLLHSPICTIFLFTDLIVHLLHLSFPDFVAEQAGLSSTWSQTLLLGGGGVFFRIVDQTMEVPGIGDRNLGPSKSWVRAETDDKFLIFLHF